MSVKLIHPITNLLSNAIINKSGNEYTKIKFDDGYIITEESFIYDILYESGIIKDKEYNKMVWENIINNTNEPILV